METLFFAVIAFAFASPIIGIIIVVVSERSQSKKA